MSDLPLRQVFYGFPSIFILFCLILATGISSTSAWFPTDFTGLIVLNRHSSWALRCPWALMPLDIEWRTHEQLDCQSKTLPHICFLKHVVCSELLHCIFPMTWYPCMKGVVYLNHTHLLQVLNWSHFHTKRNLQIYWYTFIPTFFTCYRVKCNTLFQLGMGEAGLSKLELSFLQRCQCKSFVQKICVLCLRAISI